MKRFDLIPDTFNLETLFILESPHSDEIKLGIPCVGSTGKQMAQKIIKDNRISFGELLNKKDPRVIKFGIMNTFNFPLGIPENLNFEQLEISNLKNIQWIKGLTTRLTHYEQHFEMLQKIQHLETLSNFKGRLIQYVNKCHSIKNIVICGYIAQSVYMHSFNQKIPQYNKPFILATKSKREIAMIFINHPSTRNEEWDFNTYNLIS